jgi:hypothetical protein
MSAKRSPWPKRVLLTPFPVVWAMVFCPFFPQSTGIFLSQRKIDDDAKNVFFKPSEIFTCR